MEMLIALLLLFSQCSVLKSESKVDYLEKLIEEEIERPETFVLPPDARMYEPKGNNAPLKECDNLDFVKRADCLEELIRVETEKADSFVLPTNANKYKPEVENIPVKDFGEFDYVVVGAGPTGCILANRLSEVKNWNILLLEAGTWGNDFTDIPVYGSTVKSSKYNWGYRSIPQKTACLGDSERKCDFPRGLGMGGTTLMNGLVYSRGHPEDFNRWADMGNDGWSYEEVLPYFMKTEDFHKTDEDAPVDERYHGFGGYLPVEYNMPRVEQLNEFLQANQELGYNLTDYNSPLVIGVSPTQLNTKHGKRADSGQVFIKPILHRKNLRVMTSSYVTKIHLEGDKAVGIIFSHENILYEASIRKEAVISAGAIGSPHLLMHSGIGPEQHLKKVGIPLERDLEVGSTLRQHSTYYGLTFSSNISAPIRPLKELVRQYLKGGGPLASVGPDAGLGFYRTHFENISNFPDLELMFFAPNATTTNANWISSIGEEAYQATWAGTDTTKSFLIYLINLHQHSVGTVRLNSSDPYEYPLIDPNYFSDPENHDMNVLYEGIQLALKLVETEAFRKINAKFQARPLPACKEFRPFSRDYWFCSLKYLSFDIFHPMGTCSMGPDPAKGAVVNNKCKVHGFENLRVADASVFPSTTSGHPVAVCVMIGEMVADFIKNVNFSYNKSV
ncbi:hypothetical protein JTB14_013537 [Gonioctena quinquepunctata]|nr:hypothetical protein JTB14_013537 [Gonioctena quinquepunctata]